jgi:MATE family multidrug resistance protein
MITLSVFIPLCWLMVYKVGMGTAGAALSVTICDWVEAIVLGLYIRQLLWYILQIILLTKVGLV